MAITSDTYYVSWVDANIPNNDSCQILDFSFNLGFEGGNFALLTTNVVGNLKDQVSIFTLTGTVTREGKKMSSGAYGPTTKGIFGAARLNEEFDIINNGNQYYIRYLSDQILRPLLIDRDDSMTVWDMCRNIASAAGVHISFNVVDAPYVDSLTQSGQTGLSALSSLASQVGGQLRWNGGNHYSIVYPNFFAGIYTVPSPYLLTAEGIEYENILDLGLGVTGTGVLQIPKSSLYSTKTEDVPVGTASQPIDLLYPIKNAPPSTAPPLRLPLPDDTESVKIQILITGNSAGQGAVSGPGAGFITANSSIWFDLGSPAITNPYVQRMASDYTSGSGGSFGKFFAIIPPSLFPDIPAVKNGEFVMNIGVVRRSLAQNYQDRQKDARQEEKDLMNRMLANIRYIKTYEGNISTYFHGTIPLPGMWASATNICGETVEGVIESVSFSSPGILNISVAQFLRINFLEPGVNLNSQVINQVF